MTRPMHRAAAFRLIDCPLWIVYNLIEAKGDRMMISTRRWTGDGFDTHQRVEYARHGHEWDTVPT